MRANRVSRAVAFNARPITRERRGAMLVFVAVAMVTLLGFLAMTLDVGAGNRQRRIAQTAADAGALGGGTEIYRRMSGTPMSDDSVFASATNEAVRNGFPADDVTVNYPPASGPHAGNTAYVEVIINRTIPTIFGSIFNFASLNAGARAVAGVGSYALNCLVSLDPSGPRAIAVENGGEMDTNCGVAINSTNPNALDVNSSGLLDASGSSIAISGGWTGNKTPSPSPSTGTALVQDPLSYVQPPTVTSCDQHTGLLTITKDTVLSPGVYCGGIHVTNKSVTLNPGTYITAGGGFEIETGGIIRGAGVTLINTIDNLTGSGFKPFYFGKGCKATLSAPTGGAYSGIVMYGDPAGPTDAINTFACSSDTPPELTGALYFPNQTIFFDGSNTTTEITGAVIAKNVDVSGKISITNDTSGSTAVHRLSLVE
ncbi:MAG TPA: pilus assembly protein TadG-related protein [Gemmatimonadaceae bacterium]|nr:pilus assembly protein TadG-related protein [Gemmatimonadaceae bacterium]